MAFKPSTVSFITVNQFRLAVDVNNDRRGHGVVGRGILPHELAVARAKRSDGVILTTERQNHHIAEEQGRIRVAVVDVCTAMIFPKVLRPDQLSIASIQRNQASTKSHREKAISS